MDADLLQSMESAEMSDYDVEDEYAGLKSLLDDIKERLDYAKETNIQNEEYKKDQKTYTDKIIDLEKQIKEKCNMIDRIENNTSDDKEHTNNNEINNQEDLNKILIVKNDVIKT